MTDLTDLRARLVERRGKLLARLAGDADIDQGFVAILAEVQGAITAVDAVLAEPAGCVPVSSGVEL